MEKLYAVMQKFSKFMRWLYFLFIPIWLLSMAFISKVDHNVVIFLTFLWVQYEIMEYFNTTLLDANVRLEKARFDLIMANVENINTKQKNIVEEIVNEVRKNIQPSNGVH